MNPFNLSFKNFSVLILSLALAISCSPEPNQNKDPDSSSNPRPPPASKPQLKSRVTVMLSEPYEKIRWIVSYDNKEAQENSNSVTFSFDNMNRSKYCFQFEFAVHPLPLSLCLQSIYDEKQLYFTSELISYNDKLKRLEKYTINQSGKPAQIKLGTSVITVEIKLEMN